MRIIIISLVCISLSCRKDEDIPYLAPDILKSHIEIFKSEAEKRGRKIEFHGLKIIISDKSKTQGNAGEYYKSSNTIYLDSTSDNFKYFTEELIFHELGHAVLKREHRNDSLPNNSGVASIMNCCAVDIYYDLLIFKRSYYIDELFNESTPVPAWAITH